MKECLYLAKIGELSLKKGNRNYFERKLSKNLATFLSPTKAKINVRSGRLYVTVPEDARILCEKALNSLMGITGWAEASITDKDLNAIIKVAKQKAVEAKLQGCKTFKIEVRRADKKFPLNSYELATQVGGVIHSEGILITDVHNPDIVITIEVREQAFIYGAERKARRGLPCGTAGKGLLLLSGGIDSPVAGYKMISRGMKIDCLYFHSYPYTSHEAQEKVEKLAAILAKYNLGTYLNIVSFTKIQQHIKDNVPEAYMTLMMRICMMKIADMTARYIKAKCLITGESLAQVASQTAENLNITNSASDALIFRPLIGLDKQEITEIAQYIGTYEISILPHPDCCVLFSPKHPTLHTSFDDAWQIFEKMQIDEMLKEAFENREVKKIGFEL
ncbi:MAG: tRNA 4-thiouridine(8) synthase ThiI [Treponema sp.]|nr:MAG: tRNA 4-thiouridine(8) synthase ThiI [Treponema sp.]